jgi:hypothetical protein
VRHGDEREPQQIDPPLGSGHPETGQCRLDGGGRPGAAAERLGDGSDRPQRSDDTDRDERWSGGAPLA